MSGLKDPQNRAGGEKTHTSAKQIVSQAVLPRPYLILSGVVITLYCLYVYSDVQNLFAFAVLFFVLWISSSFSYQSFDEHRRSLQAMMRRVVDVNTADWELSLAGVYVKCFVWEVWFCAQFSAALVMLAKAINLLLGESFGFLVFCLGIVAAFLIIHAALRYVEVWIVSRKHQFI
jgi:hypothetical protein